VQKQLNGKWSQIMVKGMLLTMLAVLLATYAGETRVSAQGQNLLFNSSFDSVGPLGPFTNQNTAHSPGNSAADQWNTWMNSSGFLDTELLPSEFVPGGTMIHVTTNGAGNGLTHVWNAPGNGPNTVYACAWIFILSGEVGIGTGNGGNTSFDMVLMKAGSWEVLQVSNGVSPANELIIYSHNGGAEFFVESAEIYANQSAFNQPACLPH